MKPFPAMTRLLGTLMPKISLHASSTLMRDDAPVQPAIAAATPRRWFMPARLKQKWNPALFLMALPGLLLLFVFAYLPMVGIIIAFKDFRAYLGIFGSAWVGLENFRYLFSSQIAWHITFTTVLMNALFIVTGLGAALGLALLLAEVRETNKWLARFYQSTFFLPYLLSYVVVSYFVYAVLNTQSGLANHLITTFGGKPIDWYSSPQYWPVILVLVNLWKGAGFTSVIYLASLVSISPEYYEAASLDGANRWQQIRFITLPLLKPIIIFTTLLAIGRILNADFGLFYQVPRDQGLLYPSTDVIDTYVYRALTQLGDVGQAAAAGAYQAIVGFVLVIIANWTVRRVEPDQALF